MKDSQNPEAIAWLESRPYDLRGALNTGLIPQDYYMDGEEWGYGLPQTRLFSIKWDDEYHHGENPDEPFQPCWVCERHHEEGKLTIIGGVHDNDK